MGRLERGKLGGGHLGRQQRGRGAPASLRQPQLVEGTREAVAHLRCAECTAAQALDAWARWLDATGLQAGVMRLLQAGCHRAAGYMPPGSRLDATRGVCLRLHGRLE